MAIRAGIFCFKTKIEFPCRLLLIPWARTKCAITCLQKRDSSSSVPVRYIPKTSSKVKKLEVVQQTKGLEEKEVAEFSGVKALKRKVKHCGKDTVHNNRDFYGKPQIQNQIRCSNSLFSDGQQGSPEVEDEIDHLSQAAGNELMEEREAVNEELIIHQLKSPHEQDVSRVSKTKQGAEKTAIELLAARAFTTVELRKKLSAKNFSPDTIEAVINDFTSRGLLNDSLYAEAFSRSRWSSSSWGPRRIKQALFTKGVSKFDAEKAVKLVFEDGGELDEDEELIHGLSKLSMDQLFVQTSKQWLRGQEVPREKRKSRIVHWLQYRGFNWNVIGFILKKLESQYPP